MESIYLLTLLELLNCKNPFNCWLSDDCVIDENGIRAKPIDKHTEDLLIGDEWMVLKEFEQDIKLDLPCTYADVKIWAERNGFADIFMNSDFITKGKSKPIGWPTMSLHDFIEKLLVEAFDYDDAIPMFYELLEKDGLVIRNKVIDGEAVPTDEMLAALQLREKQSDDSFGKSNFKFWDALVKESRYSVYRDDVAVAYHCAGKPSFPWFNYDDQFAWFPDTIIMPDGFSLPAQTEDFQEALLLETWTAQEALCWLKGRKVDNGRLHQLSRYYPTEYELIERAIKANKMTVDSSTPMQWVEWASSKGWLIPSLLLGLYK